MQRIRVASAANLPPAPAYSDGDLAQDARTDRETKITAAKAVRAKLLAGTALTAAVLEAIGATQD